MESVPEFHARNPPGGRGEAGGLPPIPVRMAAKQIHFPSIFHPFSIHFPSIFSNPFFVYFRRNWRMDRQLFEGCGVRMKRPWSIPMRINQRQDFIYCFLFFPLYPRVCVCVCVCVCKLAVKVLEISIHGWIDAHVNEFINGWMDGWMDEAIHGP